MPTSDGVTYGFKDVNGHPKNMREGRQTVTAFGLLAEVSTGYPVLLSEMTILTALNNRGDLGGRGETSRPAGVAVDGDHRRRRRLPASRSTRPVTSTSPSTRSARPRASTSIRRARTGTWARKRRFRRLNPFWASRSR